MGAMRILRLVVTIAMVLVPAALLIACNTVEGVGKDVSATGSAVQDAARDVKKKL